MPKIKINNKNIFFEDSGSADGKNPAVIFMHGFLMDQSMFDSQVQELAPAYRCVRWDARGFGKTDWDGKPFQIYDSVSDCIGLMDALHISSAVLVGMSQGGYCALRMALNSPVRVKGLVLMSTRSGVDEDQVKAIYRETRDTWKAMGPIDPLISGIATGILGPRTAPGMEAHWNTWIPRWKQTSGENIFHAMNCLLERDDITHRLSEIRCPALVTHGSEDFGVPIQLGEKLASDLPQCKGFIPVPAAAHAANLTHPELINKAMKTFLEKEHPFIK